LRASTGLPSIRSECIDIDRKKEVHSFSKKRLSPPRLEENYDAQTQCCREPGTNERDTHVNISDEDTFGLSFERIFVAVISLAAAAVLAYLAIEGPLYLRHITYKTADVLNNQVVAQDFVNLFLLTPLLIAAGVTLFLRKPISRYLLLLTPLYLMYFVLSYTLGIEWSSPNYLGNSEHYAFYFLFILISSLVIMLYALSIFPKKVKSTFSKKGLAVYSALFSLFLLAFASMWIREILDVLAGGTTSAYELAPAVFWVVKIFDLGFSIPLGLISIYLLWTRPDTTFAIQLLFYGFFVTMIIAVDAMGFVMFLNGDPTLKAEHLIVFCLLAVVILAGFIYVLRNHKIKT
jgi:hypothetical protein